MTNMDKLNLNKEFLKMDHSKEVINLQATPNKYSNNSLEQRILINHSLTNNQTKRLEVYLALFILRLILTL